MSLDMDSETWTICLCRLIKLLGSANIHRRPEISDNKKKGEDISLNINENNENKFPKLYLVVIVFHCIQSQTTVIF